MDRVRIVIIGGGVIGSAIAAFLGERRFAWFDTAGIALGSLGLGGEGWFDGYGLLQLLRRRAQATGARYLTDEAIGFDMTGDRISAVRLAAGEPLRSDLVVNAAGPW